MDPHTDVLREGGGVLKVMLERWNLAGSSGGTRNSQKKCQLLGVNFDWFMAILVLKKLKQIWWTAEILKEALDAQELHTQKKSTLGVNLDWFMGILVL